MNFLLNVIKSSQVGFTTLVAWFLLSLNSVVTSEEPSYKPLIIDTSPRVGIGGTRKECSALPSTKNRTVVLLVPQKPLASTLKSHPTFYWYVGEKVNHPLRFTLLAEGEKTIVVKDISRPVTGINAVKLPVNILPLEIGKTYRWTVTIVCSKTIPSRNIYATARIERVPEINTKESERDWYDVLSTNFDKDNRQTIKHLLESVNLSDLNLNYDLKANFIITYH